MSEERARRRPAELSEPSDRLATITERGIKDRMQELRPSSAKRRAVGARWLLLALLPLLLLPSWPSQAEEERPVDRVLILYTGEAHGNIEPCG